MTSTRYRPYPEYKDSGVEWLGRIPAHWEIRRLGSTVASSQNGLWGDEAQGDENDIVCVRVADFNRQRLVVCEPEEGFTIRNVTGARRSGRVLQRDDLLLEKSGGGEKQLVGAVVRFQFPGPAVCSNFIARVVTQEGHDARFLTYLHSTLYSARVNLRSIKQNTGIQNLDEKQYFGEPVSLPLQTEQQAIANFLDRETAKIDALVEKKERLIELLQEKRTSMITHAVTKGLDPDVPMKDSGIEWLGEIPAHWEACALKRLGTIRYGLGEPPREDPDGIAFVRATDISRGRIDCSTVKRVDAADVPWEREPVLRTDDIIVVRSGAYTGDSAIVPPELDGAIAGYDMFVRIQHARPRFVAWALLSTYVLKSQIDLLQLRAAQPHLNAEELGGILILSCSRSEQQAIADHLDRETARIDALIAKVQEAIERLKEYRTALISAAVTGKIDVRNEVKA